MSAEQAGAGPWIDNPTGVDLSSHDKLVIHSMFASYRRVTVVERFGAGRSGSHVYAVRPISDNDRPELPAVVKIAPADSIRQEWQAYQSFVHQKLPSIAEIHGKPVFPPSSEWGGLRYTLMGEGGMFETVSLRQYYRQAAIKDIRYVIKERLFAVIGPNWWQFSRAEADWPIRGSYDPLLPVNLSLHPATLPPDVEPIILDANTPPDILPTPGSYVKLIGFVVSEVNPQKNRATFNPPTRLDGLPASYRVRITPLPSPDSYRVTQCIDSITGCVSETRQSQLRHEIQGALEQLIDLTRDTVISPEGIVLPNPLIGLSTLLSQVRSVRVSTIHGDLNLENVLIEPAGRRVSVIDFYTVRRDHVLHDLLRLETEVVIKLLPESLRQDNHVAETICTLYQQLHKECLAPTPRPVASSLVEVPTKPYEILTLIRRMARQCLFDQNDWAEYYEGLVLYLLGSLKFDDLGRLGKQLAFWGAAVAYDLCSSFNWSHTQARREWTRLRDYLPEELYQHRQQDTCTKHLIELLRSVVTYVPRQVVIELLHEPVVAQNKGHFLHGTLLFADISGFTALSDRLQRRGAKEGAEEITRMINEYLDVMLDILFRHNGQLIKFGGDAMLCLFSGAEQGAMNAIWAAWAMKQAMTEHFAEVEVYQEAFPLQMKVGSNSGLLFAANVGTTERMEYILTGSAVEQTARAESSAEQGDILVSTETYKLVKEKLEAVQVVDTPSFYRVKSIRVQPSGDPIDCWGQVATRLSAIHQDPWAVADRLDALVPYLPVGILPQLVYDPKGGQIEGQHRQVTVLFANFVGMSKIIDAYGPQDESGIAADLGEYFRAMQEEVQYYGGVINKVDLYDQGDKLMVIFGAPIAHQWDARRAVLTALGMQNAMHRLSSPTAAALFKQRIGIHTGFVYAGNVGSSLCKRREYTVMGSTVNLAARLMSAASFDEVWVSQDVWDQVQDSVIGQAIEPIQVKGFSDPVPVYQLESARSKVQHHRTSPFTSEIIGRDAHLRSLDECYDDLLFGGGKHIVAIYGEAGVGKSRLVSEWHKNCPQDGSSVTWLTSHARAYGQETYGIFVEIVEQLLQFADDDTADARWSKLADLVQATFVGASPGWRETFLNRLAYLGQFLGLDLSIRPELAEHVAHLDPSSLQLQTRLAVCALLEHAAQTLPNKADESHSLVIVLEDLHWADRASLDLLIFAIDRVSDAIPILFCLIFRQQRELPIWALWQKIKSTHPDCLDIGLRELDYANVHQLLANLLHTQDLSNDFVELVRHETDGNPLYVEEVLHNLIEEGTLAQEKETWKLNRPVEQVHVPNTLYQIIQSRVDELDFVSPGARRVLWMASVIGSDFPEDLLFHLYARSGRKDQECWHHLRALRNAEMLKRLGRSESTSPGRAYTFRHGLVQQVAYENMLLVRQREYHRWAGEWLEETCPDQARHYGTLAYHYEQAQVWQKAFHYHWLAGQQAATGYANQEAQTHLERAIEIATDVQPDRYAIAQVRLELGQVLITQAEYDQAIGHLEQAQDLLANAFDLSAKRLQAQICYHAGYAHVFKGGTAGFEQASMWQDRGLSVVAEPTTGQVPSSAEAAALHVLGGFIAMRRGAFSQAIKEGEQALRMAQQVDAKRVMGVVYRLLSVVYHAQGCLERAMTRCRQGLAVSRDTGDLIGELKGISNLGVYAFEMDDWDTAQSCYEEAVEIATRVGDRFELGKAWVNLGDLSYHLGETSKGREQAHRAAEIFEDIQANEGLIIAYTVLATLAWRDGNYDEALTNLTSARNLAAGSQFEPTVQRWLAQVYLSLRDLDRARQAIQDLAATDRELLEDDAEPIQHLWAQILVQQGQAEEALQILEESLARLKDQNKQYQTACAQVALARVLAQAGKREEATAHARKARATFAALGARLDMLATRSAFPEI